MKRESHKSDLSGKGYCVVSDVLTNSMLETLRHRFSETRLADTSNENFGDSGGFLIADYNDPVMVKLLTWPPTLEILASFGFVAPKLHNFYVSTKPPQAKALAWHSDLFYRYDKPEPAELFLIYYLQDTSPQNGCLRVVPGSHLWSHDKRHSQPENADIRKDEVDVPVKAGSLFIGDRRLLHATHANASGDWRTCLTIAYVPLFEKLEESIQALIIQNRCLPPKDWWKGSGPTIDSNLQKVLPIYRGTTKPIFTEY